MTLLAAAASLSGAQAETLDWNSVCTRAEGTGWFPVIVPGCKEALSADGYGDYGMYSKRNALPDKCVELIFFFCLMAVQTWLAPFDILTATLPRLTTSTRSWRTTR